MLWFQIRTECVVSLEKTPLILQRDGKGEVVLQKFCTLINKSERIIAAINVKKKVPSIMSNQKN